MAGFEHGAGWDRTRYEDGMEICKAQVRKVGG